MSNKLDYEKAISFKHSDKLVQVFDGDGVLTSEIKLGNKITNKNTTNIKFGLPFARNFTPAWALLETQTTEKEILVAYRLSRLAEAYTSSLVPLNDKMNKSELGDKLKVSRNSVQKIIDKLFKLGVIAKVSVGEVDNLSQVNPKITEYWLFNPYLSFNGKVIDKTCENLFKNTYYAKMHRGG